MPLISPHRRFEGGTVHSGRRGLRAIIAAMSLIGAILVVQVTQPGAAQARCDGPGNEITSHLRGVDGVVYVTEVPVTGSCNENHYYQANYKSEFDGWRASVWLYNNGWV